MKPYLEVLDAVVYRKSQYSTLQGARAFGAAKGIETLGGYTATLDALISIQCVANLLEHNSSMEDLVFCATCNAIELEPMSLSELIGYLMVNYGG